MDRITKLKTVLGEQLRFAKVASGIKIPCQCGKSPSLNQMYRCHHCGIWFCRTCGNEHFDKDETGLVGNSLIKGKNYEERNAR